MHWKIIKSDGSFNDEEKKSAKSIACAINSNLALTYFKQQDYSQCLTKADEVLTEDPKNVKALVRRGQAYMMLGDNDLAKMNFKEALELEPNNADVKKLMEANKKRIKQEKEKERKLYGNIFNSKPKAKTKSKTKTVVNENSELKENKEKNRVQRKRRDSAH